MPPGDYKSITEQDPEHAVANYCSGNNRGSYNLTSGGRVIAEKERIATTR